MRYRLGRFVFSIVIVVLVPGLIRADDWPMYRADAARTGYSSEALPENLELRWMYRNRVMPRPAWPSSSRITFDFACRRQGGCH
ncbi:MAG: hypothetical protein ACYS74_24090 [Planctomycetota bacterium]